MSQIKNILFIAFCFLSLITHAQTKSTEVRTINNKKYYIHKVEKGQSLYAISKVYNMDVNSILAENDDAIDGLKNGQELKIPFESLLVKTNLPIDTNKYVYHKVQKGETVYAITKKYNLDDKTINALNPNIGKGIKEGEYLVVGEKKKMPSITNSNLGDTLLYTVAQGETLYGLNSKFKFTQGEILKSNPSAKDGIKQGQILKIPHQKSTKITEITNGLNNNTTTATLNPTLIKDSIVFNKPKKTSYTVGLILPFKLNEMDAINIDELYRNKANFPAIQSLAIDFLIGFKKAIDSLTTKDFEVNYTLFDIDEKDSLKIETLCKSAEFKKLDFIFGPIHANGFKIVSNYAKTLSIPVISPVTQQNKILYNNPLSSKITPSLFTLIDGLADYCSDSLMTNANIILVNTTLKDVQYLKEFKKRYNENLIAKGKTVKDSIIEVKGLAGVKSVYSSSKNNVVIALTNNHVYLQDFITQLSSFATKKEITLIGFNSVTSIDNLDQEYLNKLNFHFANEKHIDFTNPLTRQLAKEYQASCYTDPSEYYFLAYDIAMYYLGNLKTTGPTFIKNLDKLQWQGNTVDFKFFSPDATTGFENRALSIYKYQDYKLVKTGFKAR